MKHLTWKRLFYCLWEAPQIVLATWSEFPSRLRWCYERTKAFPHFVWGLRMWANSNRILAERKESFLWLTWVVTTPSSHELCLLPYRTSSWMAGHMNLDLKKRAATGKRANFKIRLQVRLSRSSNHVLHSSSEHGLQEPVALFGLWFTSRQDLFIYQNRIPCNNHSSPGLLEICTILFSPDFLGLNSVAFPGLSPVTK